MQHIYIYVYLLVFIYYSGLWIPYACLYIFAVPTNPWMLHTVATHLGASLLYCRYFSSELQLTFLWIIIHLATPFSEQWTQQKKEWCCYSRQTKWIFQNSLYTCFSMRLKNMANYVEVQWTACRHSQELCVLCDMTGWLRRAQTEE